MFLSRSESLQQDTGTSMDKCRCFGVSDLYRGEEEEEAEGVAEVGEKLNRLEQTRRGPCKSTNGLCVLANCTNEWQKRNEAKAAEIATAKVEE
jgi:hypothetical protein